MDTTRNDELYQRALKCIAGGKLSNYKSKPGVPPTFIERWEGSHLYDFDGNMYYDFEINYGPSILGRHHQKFHKRLMDELAKGYTVELGEIQLEAAEKIKECVKGVDLVRFALSGSEADMMAIRVARGYTGKNYVVKMAAHFHGSMDPLIGGISDGADNPYARDEVRPGDFYSSLCTTKGRGKHGLSDTLIIEYNDLEQARTLFEELGDEIACVIMEPLPVNIYGCRPEPGYLEGMRELCTKHNILLIFDEVITGFRLDIGGAEAYFGVTPDLWTFSKALGGGMPVAVFAGKKEYMDVITRCEVLSAGTFIGHPLSCAAVIGVIEALQENDGEVLKHVNRLGTMLAEGFEQAAKEEGVPFITQGFPDCVVPLFTEKEKIINNADALANCDMEAYWYFSRRMNQLGILNLQRYSVGFDNTEEDVKHAVDCARIVFKEIKQGLHKA